MSASRTSYTSARKSRGGAVKNGTLTPPKSLSLDFNEKPNPLLRDCGPDAPSPVKERPNPLFRNCGVPSRRSSAEQSNPITPPPTPTRRPIHSNLPPRLQKGHSNRDTSITASQTLVPNHKLLSVAELKESVETLFEKFACRAGFVTPYLVEWHRIPIHDATLHLATVYLKAGGITVEKIGSDGPLPSADLAIRTVLFKTVGHLVLKLEGKMDPYEKAAADSYPTTDRTEVWLERIQMLMCNQIRPVLVSYLMELYTKTYQQKLPPEWLDILENSGSSTSIRVQTHNGTVKMVSRRFSIEDYENWEVKQKLISDNAKPKSPSRMVQFSEQVETHEFLTDDGSSEAYFPRILIDSLPEDKVMDVNQLPHVSYPDFATPWHILVTTVGTPGDFYFRIIHPAQGSLDDLHGAMLNYYGRIDSGYESPITPLKSAPKLLSLYAAFNATDNLWYRCYVTEIENKPDENSQTACAYFLDFGDFEHIAWSHLRVLEPQFVNCLPRQAIYAYVRGCDSENSFSSSICQYFIGRAVNQQFIAQCSESEECSGIGAELEAELYYYQPGIPVENMMVLNNSLGVEIRRLLASDSEPESQQQSPSGYSHSSSNNNSSSMFSPSTSGGSMSSLNIMSPSSPFQGGSNLMVTEGSALNDRYSPPIYVNEQIVVNQSEVEIDLLGKRLLSLPLSSANMRLGLPNGEDSISYESSKITIKPFEHLPAINDFFDVVPVFIASLSNICVVPFQYLNDLVQLYDSMQDYYKSSTTFISPESVENGAFYVAECTCDYFTSSNRQFCRVMVISNRSSGSSLVVRVLLIDFGEYDVVDITLLRPLRQQFATLPYMLLRCSIDHLVQPLVSGLSSEQLQVALRKRIFRVPLVTMVDAIECIPLDTNSELGVKIMLMKVQFFDTSNPECDKVIHKELIEQGFCKGF